MKKALLLVLSILILLIANNTFALYPPHDSVVPSGMTEVTRSTRTMILTSAEYIFDPPVEGYTEIKSCDKVWYDDPRPPVIYETDLDCNRATFIPTGAGFLPGTKYTHHFYYNDSIYYWWAWFTTDNPSEIEPEQEFQMETFAMQKPQVAANSFQKVILIQDPNDGIIAYLMRTGVVIKQIQIASSYYYNKNAAPDIAMNENGMFVIAYENDYRTQRTNLIKTHHKVYDKNGNEILYNWFNHSFPYQFLEAWIYHGKHQMIMSKGGAVAAISDNGLVAMGIVKIGCPYFCEGYLTVNIWDSQNNTWTQVGEHYPEVPWEIGKTLAIPAGYNNPSNCATGAIYQCNYYFYISISSEILVASWTSYGGTCTIPGNGVYTGDGGCFRIFNSITGAPRTSDISMYQLETRYGQFLFKPDVHQRTHDIVISNIWYPNRPADVVARTYDMDGNPYVGMTYINDDLGGGDHINGHCKWAENNIACGWIANATDDCGIGVYMWLGNKYLTQIGTQKRINTCNSEKWDSSEVGDIDLSLTKWCFVLGFDTNEIGDAIFAYTLINQEYIPSIGYQGMATRREGNLVGFNTYIQHGCGPTGEVIKPVGVSSIWGAYVNLFYSTDETLWLSAGEYIIPYYLTFHLSTNITIKMGDLCSGNSVAEWVCQYGICKIENGTITIESGTLIIK